MRILVTGASGFIGSHLVAALVSRGHEVRAFARSLEKLDRALQPFEVRAGEVQIGDVTDAAAVSSAVNGCDSVVHAASVYSYDPRRSQEMNRTNVEGTQTVIAAATDDGCDPIIYISTAQVTWPKPDNGADPVPLAPLQGHAYSDSKKRAEGVAREWQDRGAPVVTTYPGGVFGPDDPGPGEQLAILRTVLVPTAPFRIDGGFPGCDIDWLTSVHVGLLEEGSQSPHVTCTGQYVTWSEWFQMARDLTGRSLPQFLPAPAWLLNASGIAMDTLQKVVPTRLPLGHESAWILTNSYAMGDEEAIRLAGPPPPLEHSVQRAIGWAFQAGHVTSRQAGNLASTPN